MLTNGDTSSDKSDVSVEKMLQTTRSDLLEHSIPKHIQSFVPKYLKL